MKTDKSCSTNAINIFKLLKLYFLFVPRQAFSWNKLSQEAESPGLSKVYIVHENILSFFFYCFQKLRCSLNLSKWIGWVVVQTSWETFKGFLWAPSVCLHSFFETLLTVFWRMLQIVEPLNSDESFRHEKSPKLRGRTSFTLTQMTWN